MKTLVLCFADALYKRLERRASAQGHTLKGLLLGYLVNRFPGEFLSHFEQGYLLPKNNDRNLSPKAERRLS